MKSGHPLFCYDHVLTSSLLFGSGIVVAAAHYKGNPRAPQGQAASALPFHSRGVPPVANQEQRAAHPFVPTPNKNLEKDVRRVLA